MKNLSDLFQFSGLSIKKKVEPSILLNLKSYPQSHIPLILQIQGGLTSHIEKHLNRIGCKNIIYFPIINGFYILTPLTSLSTIFRLPALTYISNNHKVSSYLHDNGETQNSVQFNQYGVTGRNVTIAHLDTGIYPHGDLIRPKNRIIYFKDFINNYSSPYDDHGHGTHCAGCIAGNGILSQGVNKGIAPDALLIGLKCLDEGGTGDIKSTLEGLQWVLDNKDKYNIRILHIPFGVNYPYLIMGDPLVKAVEKLWQEGVIVICAAGNNGPNNASIASPGTSKDVITVGCSIMNARPNTSNSICHFSSRGPTLAGFNKPNLVMPGRDILSLSCDTSFSPSIQGKNTKRSLETPYISFSGTSTSSSFVAGAVALLLEKYPNLTPEEVKLALEMSCNSLHLERNIQGKGLLDIEKLLTISIS